MLMCMVGVVRLVEALLLDSHHPMIYHTKTNSESQVGADQRTLTRNPQSTPRNSEKASRIPEEPSKNLQEAFRNLQSAPKKRQEALNRLRAFGHLSIEQENDWELFAKEWDARMAETHCAAWGGLFAEIIANVVSELEGGNANALSDFMRKESQRVLGSVPMVRIPGRGH